MKKQILFVIPSLSAGGGEKSLVNLLHTIDFDRYQVDLVLLHKSGIFLKILAPQVNIVEMGGDYKIFQKGLGQSVKQALLQLKWKLATNRILFALKNKSEKNKAIAEQLGWKFMAASIKPLEKHYDAAIGFLEKSSIYFVVDKVKANNKIGFIHNDYEKLGLDAKLDKPYFSKLDALVTVSEACEKSLKRIFPEIEKNISVMYNIVSPKLIHDLADSEMPAEIKPNTLSLLSIGRLQAQKGFDMAIDACEILVRNGHDIKWYIIGEGEDRQKLQAKIDEKNLTSHLLLLGLRENPYPYLKHSLIYVQTSRYEGKSIAIDEAKIMAKPIVVTNFSTVNDQIQQDVNGIITDMDPQSIADGIQATITNIALRDRLSENLRKEDLSTESEIETLYNLIEKT